MKNVLLTQKGNPVISKSVTGITNSIVNHENAIYTKLTKLTLAYKEVNAILSVSSKENKYEENLLYFRKREVLNKNGHSCIKNTYFESNYSYQLNDLLAEYLMSHFTLYELYVMFFQFQSVFGFDVVKEAKRIAIESIDSETQLLTTKRIKRLKKIVWDMNKIWFGLILNFVMVNNLFWDEKTHKTIRPEFTLSK